MSLIFLITANVGSVFENIDTGLPIWLNELTSKIQSNNPDFLALHFQETGGKDYKNGSIVIQNFFTRLIENFNNAGYNLLEGIVDSEADIKHEFTALSNLYFIHKNCTTAVDIWDFDSKKFVLLNSTTRGQLFIGKEIKSNAWNQKEKFPQEFFPNLKWSRKGFARARWRIGGQIFDLVNIHLFHDSHNLVAASTFPSPFSQNRQRTLNFMLEKFANDDLENVPLFIFGDFNFRLNTFDVVDILRKEGQMKNGNDDDTSSSSSSMTSDLIIDDTKFSVTNHEQKFKEDWQWLRPYDFERIAFENLTEVEVNFHPTYPFAEDHPGKFMKTRCPSWCDRVLFTKESTKIMAAEPVAEYNLIGSNVCMGDHKPVYLKFHLNAKIPSNSGLHHGEVRKSSEHDGRSEVSSLEEPGISLPPPSRSRFVSFLRDNLSFHIEPPKTRVSKSPSLAPSSTSTASASSCSTTTNCCFLKLRNNSGTGESQSLTKKEAKRGKQNLLISSETSNPLLGIDQIKKRQIDTENEICVTRLEIRNKGSSSEFEETSMCRAEAKRDDDKSTTGKCCPGCHII